MKFKKMSDYTPTVTKRVPVDLLERAKDDGIGIVHIRSDYGDPKGGLTIAFRKVTPFTSGVMVYVAVQTCSREDTFSRAKGTTGALEKFYSGEVIQLPLLSRYCGAHINEAVKDSFIALYNVV